MMMSGSNRIKKLDATVVNRIAAGEVVQRPSAAIKELLENSLDAGSTSITITVKQGGLGLIQIADNGSGIHKDDLEIVCERFTTSKLTKFDDLSKISTFGFRGEALASITHVAHVSIISRTADSPCAFRAKYCDGKLIPFGPGEKAEAKPVAGIVGTTITVEDLFYNMPTRKAAFKNFNEEYLRILDVVSKYAIRFGDDHISFTCKKHGQMSPDLHTASTANTLDNIRQVYGDEIARELIDIKLEFGGDAVSSDSLMFTLNGKVSNGNYFGKKGAYIFFINNRLVESSSLKKVIEAAYHDILPKTSHPFVYLNIKMPPQNIDVNVHPTKKEVHMLYEDSFLEQIYSHMKNLLLNANDSRVFIVEKLIPVTVPAPSQRVEMESSLPITKSQNSSSENENISYSQASPSNLTTPPIQAKDLMALKRGFAFGSSNEKVSKPKLAANSSSGTSASKAPNKMVRVDHTLQSIQSYFKPASMQTTNSVAISSDDLPMEVVENAEEAVDASEFCYCQEVGTMPTAGFPTNSLTCDCCGLRKQEVVTQSVDPSEDVFLPDFPKTNCKLNSVQSLINEIQQNHDINFGEMTKTFSYVGPVDVSFSLVQCDTRLMLVDHELLLYHLFYQLCIFRFGEMDKLILEMPIDIRKCVKIALEAGNVIYDEDKDGNKKNIVEAVTMKLIENAPMLFEYFCIEISQDGVLLSMPALLPNYQPAAECLPEFILLLATETNWKEEKQCFFDIAQRIAKLYSQTSIENGSEIVNESDTLMVPSSESKWQLEHLLLPAVKKYLIAPKNVLQTRAIVEVTSLEKLYKIFERC